MAFSFTDQGTTGTIPAPIRAVAPKLNLAPSAPFFLKWHPQRWELNGGELLPKLGRLAVEPGVNGVDKHGDPSLAFVSAEQRGWKILPWDVIADGYVRVHQGNFGAVHLTKWQQPRQIGNRCILKHDADGYRQFLREMLAAGIIDPPDPDLIDAMIEEKQGKLDRARQSAASGKPGADLAIASAETALKEFKAAAAAVTAPRSKSKRGRSNG